MARCEFCGKPVTLPFRCNYCGKFFCEDHRLPPKHNCPYITQWGRKDPPAKKTEAVATYPIERVTQDQVWVPIYVNKSRTKKRRKKRPLKLIMALLFLFALMYVFAENDFLEQSIADVGGNDIIDAFQNLSVSLTPTPVDLREKLWRYDFKYALEVALSEPELNKIEKLASELRGSNIKESAWNILEWEDENIVYNQIKAMTPGALITYHYEGDIITDVEITTFGDSYIQTPSETVEEGSGICSDYAILTAGLLLAMGYFPVYIFDMEFKDSDVGHIAAAIKVNNQYFILDQHPPVWDLGRYYHYRADEGEVIRKAVVYAVYKGEQYATVKEVQELDAESFLKNTYRVTLSDLERLRAELMNEFEKRYYLTRDYSIQNIDSSSYLPRGYSYGVTWTLKYDDSYYHPQFQKFFIRHVIDHLDERILDDIWECNRFWIKVNHEGDNIVIKILLARK